MQSELEREQRQYDNKDSIDNIITSRIETKFNVFINGV